MFFCGKVNWFRERLLSTDVRTNITHLWTVNVHTRVHVYVRYIYPRTFSRTPFSRRTLGKKVKVYLLIREVTLEDGGDFYFTVHQDSNKTTLDWIEITQAVSGTHRWDHMKRPQIHYMVLYDHWTYLDYGTLPSDRIRSSFRFITASLKTDYVFPPKIMCRNMSRGLEYLSVVFHILLYTVLVTVNAGSRLHVFFFFLNLYSYRFRSPCRTMLFPSRSFNKQNSFSQ